MDRACRTHGKKVHTDFVGNPEGMRPIGRSRCSGKIILE
jgi:hypothetical protein